MKLLAEFKTWKKMKSKILYNPFTVIAGFKSLLIGLVVLIFTTILAYITGTHFNGLLNIDFAKDSAYWVFMIESSINWLLISFFFYLSGIILSNSKIRIIDVMGTALMSRIPIILTPIIRLIPVFKSFMEQSWQYYIIIGVYLFSLVWTVVLNYNAFKISCNLKDNRLNITFILSLVLAEVGTKLIIILFI
jgi:hypothetical protein